MFDKHIVKQHTVDEMTTAYQQAEQLIKDGYQKFDQADEILNAAFITDRLGTFETIDKYGRGENTAEASLKRIKKHAWQQVINKIGLEKMITGKRRDELRKNVEDGKMPPFTTADIMNFMQMLSGSAQDLTKEIITEAFQVLTPGRRDHRRREAYKTNEKYARRSVGKKAILTWIVEQRYGGGLQVKYQSQDKMLLIDKAFHLLDGKGIPDGYQSPLIDAINNNPVGHTEYFTYKAYQNSNLHITFRRPDLVKEMNKIAGDGTLSDSAQ